MSARIIDGKALAKALREEVKVGVAGLARTPRLVSVAVGEDEAVASYTRSQAKQASKLGIDYELKTLADDATAETVASTLRELDTDTTVDAVMLQTPLPRGMNVTALRDEISVAKDVEAVTTLSFGRLAQNRPLVSPCTAEAALRCLLEAFDGDLAGRRITVVGRSDVVGKPLGFLLLHHHATPTICHSRTSDLAAAMNGADAIVAAVGVPGLVTAKMVPDGAVVVDVGTNWDGSKLVGDVSFDGVSAKASAITPVPGGVGPVTVAVLMNNVLTLARASSD